MPEVQHLQHYTNLGVSRRQITKELQKYIIGSKKKHIWQLYVGSTHHACLHLINHEEAVIQLFNIQSSVPKWSKICVEELHHQKNIIELRSMGSYNIQPSYPVRLLQRLEEHGLELPTLNRHLIARQNGDWLELLYNTRDDRSRQIVQHIQ